MTATDNAIQHGYDGHMVKPKYLDYQDVADSIGVTVPVVRKYLSEARKRREEGRPMAKDIPEPDKVFGPSPAWLPKTIEDWKARRPGRGAGGGRKPHAHARARSDKVPA